jgi:4-aminobutyrate aminotransferase/(S)-3-amino-2-methylpropionate transaminase
MSKVFTSSHGSDANKTAFKAAFMHRMSQERGSRDANFTNEESLTCMRNAQPGSPNLSILSFQHGFHGRLFGTLSATRSRPLHKMDIPAFNWPCAPFPLLKYPLDKHEAENAEIEAGCLAKTEHIIKTHPSPPAAMIVEPILAEGGDKHASPDYFRKLRALAAKHGILFIVDEVQTGMGATGQLWAHQHWQLDQPPDIVTFGKKAQTAGWFYGNPDLAPKTPYRQYNTWMGDEPRAMLFTTIYREMERLQLVEKTASVGSYLMDGLKDIASRHGAMIQNLRGAGTFIAWDCPQRENFITRMRRRGTLVGGCGTHTVRLRPMLIFRESHGNLLLSTIERVLNEMETSHYCHYALGDSAISSGVVGKQYEVAGGLS